LHIHARTRGRLAGQGLHDYAHGCIAANIRTATADGKIIDEPRSAGLRPYAPEKAKQFGFGALYPEARLQRSPQRAYVYKPGGLPPRSQKCPQAQAIKDNRSSSGYEQEPVLFGNALADCGPVMTRSAVADP
jgi:hypothetical protein